MDTAFVTGLDRVDPADLAAAGGKAANLAELIGAGFRVPDGFCLGTAAYARAATAAGLGTGPDAAVAGDALRAVTVAEEIAREVRAAYAALGPDVPVAVRSSATAEDLPTASFAGQQDTYLNVVGPGALLDAVRRCWASLWTGRAVAYRATAGVDPGGVRLAVVVQRMVDADVAGVLFTADPVTGHRGRTVIDAAPGLGEAVVSGAVNPDRIVVEPDGAVAEYRVGDKATAVRAVAGGGVERTAVPAGGDRCLSAARIAELVALGRQVEAHFGAPQDLEWAFDTSGTLWLLQARPITTLYPLPAPAAPGLRAYLCVSLAQGLTRPITPMGISAFRVIAARAAREAFRAPVADPLAGPAAFATAGGRVFADITPVLHSPGGSRLAPALLDVMEARSAVVLRALSARPELAPRGRSPVPFVLGVLRTLAHFRAPLVLLRALASPEAGLRHAERVGRRVRVLRPLGPGAPARDRLDHAVRLLDGVFPMIPTVVPVAGAGFAGLGAARLLAGPALDSGAVHDVLRSLPHNCTTEMDLQLWAVAVRVRADAASAAALAGHPPAELSARYRRGELPAVLARELDAFLAEHGHRAVAEIDLGLPRWSDDPSHLLGALANYLRDDGGDPPDVRFARGARAAEAAVARVVDRVRERSAWRARLTALALDRTRRLAGMREEHKDLLVRLLAAARAELAAVGAELADRGLLDDPTDVFFLELDEAGAALDGVDHRDRVRARRDEYTRELARRHVPRVLLSDGTEPEAEPGTGPAGADGALTGSPASAGTVTAPARVVLAPDGAHVEPGEILVCPSTDPGWTPLFLTAGGLVMEMGGSNSHGAVVAREYGIPAVVGVAGATERIASGDLLTVDGGAGLVRRG
ncbi:phosphoenolpyruvate synthase [Pseudonocardia sp. C8]|uniref:PEP/pyruvate-binding domain-containing protein n=1 Tax=Pseudonocardia sp. C8 TaxID=2762759 RepID=UPI001642FCF9|nr:PEP/pyruvate-binding domain-containing protein [Pseudonocardia sp. C8]MBC3191543.1 phosphoenolpyruvate synthase [Pseudonocardia sp. C8]